ncbi:hypothetical protein MLD38_010210 [Melastoma candidum]|nr:hypothetical protein MLD38_010210 [Melastoma candidum]
MKNLEAPFKEHADPSDLARFESSSLTKSLEDEATSGLSYGLTIRQNPAPKIDVSDQGGNLIDDECEEEREDLREQLGKLGDDPGVKEYEDVAVEDFAKALMAGYGWKEGMGIGRNVKADVKVKQIERRGGREGLGFKEFDVKLSAKSRDSRELPHEELEPTKVMPDSRGEESGVRIGAIVRVVGGSRQDLIGLKGKVVEVRGSRGSVVLTINKLNEDVMVRLRDVAELGSAEEERCLRKLKDLGISTHSNGSTKRDRAEAASVGGQRGWLMTLIRVRVISKELKGGRLYKKKGEVVDVVGPRSCNILMDEDKELVQDIDQDYLETALPKRGGPVFVLSGRYKGVLGNLVERDLDQETGVVHDFDTHKLLNVRLEQIAEYLGDPSMVRK